MNKMDFPEKFLWGASSSAFQMEGAQFEDGKGASIRDVVPMADWTKVSDLSVTSDHYHRMEEDVRLFGELGLKAYRFSISWARVMPDGYTVNPKGLRFYERLIKLLREQNIDPVVTIMHYDTPYALIEQGGWEDRRTIDAFVRYADLLFRTFGGDVKYWQTVNEHNCLIFDDQLFTDPGLKPVTEKVRFQVNHNLLVASAKVFRLCHEKYPGLKIGPAPQIGFAYPASSDPMDVIAAGNMNSLMNYLILDASVWGRYNDIVWKYLEKKGCTPEILPGDMEAMREGNPDFIAFNYYMSGCAAWPEDGDREDLEHGPGGCRPGFFKGRKNPHVQRVYLGKEIDPIGLRVTLRELYSRYHKPLLITENGLGMPDVLEPGDVINDDYRIDVLRRHIEQCRLAINEDGVDLMGYCPWSVMDLVSLHEGINKRYGFIYVNRDEHDLKDLRRIKKKSFDWYKKLIESNGKTL